MKLKAVYRVSELARMSGIPERTLRKWIDKRHVAVMRVDRSVLVPITAFRDAFPQLWSAICLENSLNAVAKCPVCGSEVRG